MKVHLDHLSFYLLIGTLFLAIGFTVAFTCPEQCSCVEVPRRGYAYIHAKCTALDGLKKLGKTPELHSLDLSSSNLTKINNQLDKLTNLSKLDLADNRLSEINVLSTKRIRVLNLSGNRIPSGKLSKIPSTVKNLNLSNNDITILEESFKHFTQLRSLELADNPLNCTCETLEIRNWLQERQVWTEKPIRCAAPIQFKGWSWLQVSQSKVCDPNGIETPRMLPFSEQANDPSLNDLMMGDDPNVHHTDDISENDEGFLPVSVNGPRTKRKDDDLDDSYEEGSGDNDEIVTKTTETNDHTEMYEGSGHEQPIVPIDLDGDDQSSNEDQPNETENDQDAVDDSISHIENEQLKENNNVTETPVPQENDANTIVPPIVEDPIVPIESKTNDAEFIQTNGENKDSDQGESANLGSSEQVQQGNTTYIVLGVMLVLLVVLILYVSAKRTKTNTKNRRNNNDIESPAQEMLTMDKNNLGKPIQSPVEFIPLIPENHEHDKKINLCNGEEPLLQKLTEVENENGDVKKTNDKHLNGNAKPVQNGVQNGLHPENNIDDKAVKDQRQHQSISPKPSRYSPVSMFTI